MHVVKWEKQNNVALITMTNEENRMDLLFVEEMHQALDEIITDESIMSVVITSNDAKYFSLGVNVTWFMERFKVKDTISIKKFLFGMSDIFKKVLLYPVPVIAAINGHAYGNGSILACACDYRFMRSDRGYFCFPEVDVNIPFLPSMILWLTKVVPHSLFHDMALTGRKVSALELEKHNVIVKACKSTDELMDEAMSFAATFNKGRTILGEIKKRMHNHIIQTMKTEDIPILESLDIIVRDE